MRTLVPAALLALACAVPSSKPKPEVAAASPASAPPSPAPSAVAPPAPASATPPADGQLHLARLDLTNAKGEGLRLELDGNVTVPTEGRHVGKLRPDGRFVAEDGSTIARLAPDGLVYAGEDRKLAVTIDADGGIHPPNGPVMRFSAEGRLEGGNPNAPETKLVGLTPDTRRTGAFLLVLAGFPTRH